MWCGASSKPSRRARKSRARSSGGRNPSGVPWARRHLLNAIDAADVVAAVRDCESALGPITFLVSNADVPGPFGPIGVIDAEEWWQAQCVHLRAPLLLASAVLPGMRSRKRGRILCINSTGGVSVQNNLSAYCVGKAAQLRLVEHIDSENRVNPFDRYSYRHSKLAASSTRPVPLYRAI